MKRNRKILGVALVLFLVALLLPATIFADDEGTVTCTVSGKLISVTVTDGDVDYGVLELEASQNTTAAGLNDTQTANNNGTVAEDFNIKSSDAVGGTQWTLGAAQGDNTFTHTASIDAGSTWDKAMTTADVYVSLATNIAKDADRTFDLRIEMPTTITDYTAKTITVTVQATEYTAA